MSHRSVVWLVCGAVLITWSVLAYLNGHDHRMGDQRIKQSKIEACSHAPDVPRCVNKLD